MGDGTSSPPAAEGPSTAYATHREIGASLFLSINTVKGYSNVLYRKLGVATCHDAMNRVRRLGLL